LIKFEVFDEVIFDELSDPLYAFLLFIAKGVVPKSFWLTYFTRSERLVKRLCQKEKFDRNVEGSRAFEECKLESLNKDEFFTILLRITLCVSTD
jgi:hypothetical protein